MAFVVADSLRVSGHWQGCLQGWPCARGAPVVSTLQLGVSYLVASMQIANKPQARSVITNGKRLHHRETDARTRSARRWRDVYNGLVAELGRAPSFAEDQLLRSCSDLAITAEALSARVADGQLVDHGELSQINGSLRRTLMALGMAKREAASGTPELGNLL
jgi:hypothetical protein